MSVATSHAQSSWNPFGAEPFLRAIGAAAVSREDGRFHPTLVDTGIPDVFATWAAAGLPEPRIEEAFGEAERTTLMLMLETPDEGIGHGASTAIAMSADNTDDNADNARDTLLVEDGLGDSERAVLRCIAENPDAALEETGMAVGIGRTAVANHTSSLQRRGLLKRVGSRKTGHWEVQGGAR